MRQLGSVILLIAIGVSLLFSSLAVAQVATIDFSAERNFVYQDGVYSTPGEALLPFVVSASNPGITTINDLEFTIAMVAGVSLGNVDPECVETSDSQVRVLSCSIDEIKPTRTKLIDFFVDGPNSLEAGSQFRLSLESASASILEADAVEATLADGDRRIRGANLDVHLVRNIDLDINQNGVSDLDETIMNLPVNTSVAGLLARQAVIDVLFIYSPTALQYLGSKLESRIAQLLTNTNQLYRENDVAIKFNGVGLEEIPYTANDSALLDTFDALQTKTDPAFDELDNLITSSGGDIVVFMHALDTSIDPYCSWSTINAVGRQGDFQAAYHQGNLLVTIDVGPDCIGLLDLTTPFALNMGIAPHRQDYPDGGTFSFSSGYAVTDEFTTLTARVGDTSFGATTSLNRFSNPQSLCKSLACGVDRNDIATGADAVYSLNKTRHLVSAITPSKFPVEPEAIADKISILDSSYDLEITQTAVESGALINEFTEIEVRVSNPTSATLSNVNLLFAHVNAGSLVQEAQLYENSSSVCTILGSTLSVDEIAVGDAIQKIGTLNCFIEAIAPAQEISFSYRIQIDATPPLLNTDAYYHEVVAVNTIPQPESLLCIPVFSTFVEAAAGSTVCDAVASLPLDFLPGQTQAAIDELATVTGSMLSVPYIRLDDGGLISAEFKITNIGEVQFELLSYQVLDSSLAPLVEATFTDAGVLSLANLSVGAANYDVQATLVPDSNPLRLNSLNIVLLGP